LEILQIDGRASASYIAEKIGLSVPAVSERIKKLQDTGIISGFYAKVNHKRIGLDVSALITIISESSDHYGDVIREANDNKNVIQCFSTTGNGSHVLLIKTQNTDSLEKLLRSIQSWPGVMRTETQLVLSSYKDMTPIPLN
ncbi:MAG: Lrp/AsnC family transcriptional regulator, partial [Candidatus Marinimicrobia bacterium]|nr:Lrp/AsnC family transcriptional regulator [Candidatus Neomarinimicrobiota bacterium]